MILKMVMVIKAKIISFFEEGLRLFEYCSPPNVMNFQVLGSLQTFV